MISYLRRRMAMLDIISTSQYVLIRGIDKFGLFKDINVYWEVSQITKYMFMTSSSSDVKFQHYFLPDFIYMMRQLEQAKRTYLPKRTYERLIELLLEKTWIGDAEQKPVKSLIDEKTLGSQCPWPLKDYQIGAIKQYGTIVPAYNLRGYLLDAGTGSGKTMIGIEWSESLHASKTIVICPPNIVAPVWGAHLREVIKYPKRTWLSTEGQSLSLDYDYYVVHYQQLDMLLDYVRLHAKDFKNVALIIDESHNLNKVTADRTLNTIDVRTVLGVQNTLFESATAIGAVGLECIPFLRISDPLFTPDVEERYRRIYGKSAKRANEILQNRLGIMKYYIPKQELPNVVESHYDINVKLPDGKDFTLAKISKHLRDFMMERMSFYEANKAKYTATYEECIGLFEATLKPNEMPQYREYKANIAVIRQGFDPSEHKAISQFCNHYERKVISPRLPDKMRHAFRDAKSVVKYPKLKVMGEALGLLGKYRSECHLEMVDHIDMATYIDGAKKKTVIFSSYVDVVEAAAQKLRAEGYMPVVVHGMMGKSIPELLREFNTNPDANPLITTFQSLSTGVPLISANRTLYLNYPFRAIIKTQADGRTSRLGQTENCDYFGFLLDTGNEPNVSTRNLDIMAWSAEQVGSIMGVKNIDLDAYSTESILEDYDHDYIPGFEEPDDAEIITNYSIEQELLSMESTTHMPPGLFHGSMYKQKELMPGFKRSGQLVKWDVHESNKWLYATSSKQEAILLGIGSAAEKTLDMEQYSYDLNTMKMTIKLPGNVTVNDLSKLEVYVYTISPDVEDGWHKNHNASNKITTEWKTERTIDDNLVKVERVDVAAVLRDWDIRFT